MDGGGAAVASGDPISLSALYGHPGDEEDNVAGILGHGEEAQQLVLLGAAKTGSVAHVRRILATDGVDANERDARLFTPLMWACANGHFRCVEALVKAPKEKAVSLVARNESGDTALHWACWKGNPDAVWLLLGAGADASVVGDSGMMPLHYAATGNHRDAVDALLQFGGVDMTVRNDYGNAAWELTTDPTVREVISAAARETHCAICADEFNRYRFRHVCNYCRQVTCEKPSCSRLKPPEEGKYNGTRVCHSCVEIDKEETARRQAEEAERERIAKLNASYTFTVKIGEALNALPSEEALGDLLATRNTGGGPVADFVIPATVRPSIPPRPPGSWVHIKLYLSSTYEDFHAERVYLRQTVVPALRHFARMRRVHITLVDLRDDGDAELAYSDDFLEVALESIDECSPFMVCMLGERYGWVPDSYEIPELPKFAQIAQVEEGSRSTTEMEIKYGFLDRTATSLPFFYTRDPKFMSSAKFKALDDNVRQVFEETDDNARLKLKSLKDEVTQLCPAQQLTTDYPCEYDHVTPGGQPMLSGLEEFGRRVFTDIWTALEVAYPKREVGEKHAVVRDLHESHLRRLTVNFHGRAKVLGALEEYAHGAAEEFAALVASGGGAGNTPGGGIGGSSAVPSSGDPSGAGGESNGATNANAQLGSSADDEPSPPLLLVGDDGVGKSALIAELVRRFRESAGKLSGGAATATAPAAPPAAYPPFAFAHFVGAVPGSDNARDLLLRVCQELSAHFALGATPGLLAKMTFEQLRRTVRLMLTEAASRGPVLLCFDSLHRLTSEGLHPLTPAGELVTWFRPEILDWIPAQLPRCVRVVVSSGRSGAAAEWLSGRFFNYQVTVGPLEESDAKDIVRGLCQAYARDIDREQLGLLLRKQDSNRPLFLAVVGDTLRRCRTVDEVTRAIKDTPGMLCVDPKPVHGSGSGDAGGGDGGEDGAQQQSQQQQAAAAAKALASGSSSLFVRLLERLEAEYGAEAVACAMSGIYCSPTGFTEEDILSTAAAIFESLAHAHSRGIHSSETSNDGGAGGGDGGGNSGGGAGGGGSGSAKPAGAGAGAGAGVGSGPPPLTPSSLAHLLYRLRPLLISPVGSDGYKFAHPLFARVVRDRYLADGVAAFHKRIATHYRRVCDPRGERTWTSPYDRGLLQLPVHLMEAGNHGELQVDMCDARYLERRCQVTSVPATLEWYRALLAEPVFSEEVYVKLFQRFTEGWTSMPPRETATYTPQLRLLMDQLVGVVNEHVANATFNLELARRALMELSEDDLRELAAQKKPPSSVQHIAEVTMLCKGAKGTKWRSARAVIGSPGFIDELCGVSPPDLREKAAAKAAKILDHHSFSVWDVRLKSPAAAVMLQWATAVLHHHRSHAAHLEHDRLNRYNFDTVPESDRQEAVARLGRAVQALRGVTKGDLNELRSQTRPPEIARTVMAGILTMLGGPQGSVTGLGADGERTITWQDARPKLGDPHLIPQLASFDRDGVLRDTLNRVEAVVDQSGDPELQAAASVSSALGALAEWLTAARKYVRLMLGAERSGEKRRKKKKAVPGKEKA